jgi:uncharacterized protein YciI
MNRAVIFSSALLLSSMLFAQKVAATPDTHSANAPKEFDSFIIVLLVKSANAPQMAKEKLDELQEAHLANIKRMAQEGKLLKAGPFEDYTGRNVRGMFIFNSYSKEQVQEWVASDPLVKAGRLAPEYLKWFVEKGSLK